MALHITLRFGDFIEIKHGDDRAIISVHKRSGTEARVSVEAPKTFKVKSRKILEQPPKDKVKCGAI